MMQSLLSDTETVKLVTDHANSEQNAEWLFVLVNLSFENVYTFVMGFASLGIPPENFRAGSFTIWDYDDRRPAHLSVIAVAKDAIDIASLESYLSIVSDGKDRFIVTNDQKIGERVSKYIARGFAPIELSRLN